MFRLLWSLMVAFLWAASLLPARAEADKPKEGPAPNTLPLTIRNYGHAFIYIITSTGVRIAIDPYGENAPLTYTFPSNLPADVVLISNESADHDGSVRLFGSPQIFASVTAIGLNNARGLFFRGVQTFPTRNDDGHGITNASFTFTLDGIRFCHLGAIGHPLTPAQLSQIGTVDVLFLPVGNPDLSPSELAKMVDQTGARIVIPITYQTKYSSDMKLRTLKEFLNGIPYATVKDLKGTTELILKPGDLPAKPIYYLLPIVQTEETDDTATPPVPAQ